jgi:hypothetical protein
MQRAPGPRHLVDASVRIVLLCCYTDQHQCVNFAGSRPRKAAATSRAAARWSRMPTGPSTANCSTGGLARRRLPSLRWPPSLARSPRQHPAAVHQSDGARAHRWSDAVETFRSFVVSFSKSTCVQEPAAGMLMYHSANTARMPKGGCGCGLGFLLSAFSWASVCHWSM